MCSEIGVKVVGKIRFADSWSLFGDIEDLPNSFKTQSLIINAVNVDEVITRFYLAQSNQQTEAGCRLNIGFYLANAVYLARKYLAAGKIALFHEVYCEHPNLPGIGHVTGSLDYLTSTYGGVDNIGDFVPALVTLAKPWLLIVDWAKSSNTFGKTTAYQQLVTQLLTVENFDE